MRRKSFGALIVGVGLTVGCGASVALPGAGGDGGAACPASPPADASPCSGALVCEYGTDCKKTFQCANGAWITDHHTCTPACPEVQPESGTSCSIEGQLCQYPGSGTCPEAGSEASCSGGQWFVTTFGTGCAAACPTTVPVMGHPCDGCCDGPCTYPTAPGCPDVTAVCSSSGWMVPDVFCAGSPCAGHTTPADCGADAACRWLVPGCTAPALPSAGCHPAADCIDGSDCAPGLACLELSVDPCWAAGCAACAAPARVCVPPPPPGG